MLVRIIVNQLGMNIRPSLLIVSIFFIAKAALALPAGDLAPRGAPDGLLSAGDYLVLQRIIMGVETANSYEQLVGDVAPLNNPDGSLDVGDLVVLMRAILGEISLPAVSDTNPPQISIAAPVDGSTLTQTSVNVVGLLDEPANVFVNGVNLNTVLSFNVPVILQQGLNTITVLAVDLSGNISTQIINVTVDSRAPTPVNLTRLGISDPGTGQVTFTGSDGVVEPGATVRFTNMTTGVVTTANADAATGSFVQSLDANTADVILVEVIDAAGNSSDSISYTVGAAVQIVTPSQNTVVEGSSVNVSGFFVGGANSGVGVSGLTGCVYANSFYINNFPLQSGSNTLTAALTDQTGAGGQHSVMLTSNANPKLTFEADNNCDIAPMDVDFDIGTLDINVVQIDIDFNGDGVVDLTTTDVNSAITTTYTTPGVFIATVWILDDQGNEHERRLSIVVQDETIQKDLFQQIWSNFSIALAAGDAATALQSVLTQYRGFYGPVLQALAANLPAIAGDLSGIRKIQISGDVAEYAVLTVVDGQVRTFVVTFMKDSDGIWRILSM